MKHCHMANGHPDEKYQNSPTGGQRSPTGGGLKLPCAPPVAPRLQLASMLAEQRLSYSPYDNNDFNINLWQYMLLTDASVVGR